MNTKKVACYVGHNRVNRIASETGWSKSHAWQSDEGWCAKPHRFIELCTWEVEGEGDPRATFLAIDNATKAVVALGQFVEALPGKCGGKLVLRGTRFTIGQLIAELADDGESIRSVCDNYDLDGEQVVNALHALAAGLSRPVA